MEFRSSGWVVRKPREIGDGAVLEVQGSGIRPEAGFEEVGSQTVLCGRAVRL